MKPESPFYEHCRVALKQSDLFSGLDEKTLEILLSLFQRETWPKGAHLPPRQTLKLFTVIISGRLDLTKTNPETGRQFSLLTLTPGDAHDVITLLDNKEHYLEPIALEPLEVITSPLKTIRGWISEHSAFNQALLPYLGQKFRELENHSAELVLYDTFTRLSLLILDQATPDPSLRIRRQQPLPLINTLSDETMARMIGSVRVVVNRHIQELTRLDLIHTKRGQLVVNDLERLRKYCEDLLGP